MYKKFTINKKWAIAFHKFSNHMKHLTFVGNVYKTGIRNWDSDGFYTYSLVLGNFRIMIYKDKNTGYSCN